MSPSWGRLKPLLPLSGLNRILDIETEPRCLPRRGTLQIRSVDSASLVYRSPGLLTAIAITAKKQIPAKLSPSRGSLDFSFLVPVYPRTSRSQSFFFFSFGCPLD